MDGFGNFQNFKHDISVDTIKHLLHGWVILLNSEDYLVTEVTQYSMPDHVSKEPYVPTRLLYHPKSTGVACVVGLFGETAKTKMQPTVN